MFSRVLARLHQGAGALTALALISGFPGSLQAQAPPPLQPFQILMSGQTGSYLGVGLREVDPARARELKLKEERGVEITNVAEDSPAEKAGIQKGDVVLEYNGQRVEGTEQFGRIVRETPAGRTAKLTIWRNGASQTLNATVAAMKDSRTLRDLLGHQRTIVLPQSEIRIPDIPSAFTILRSGMLGVHVEALEGQLAQYFGVTKGVLVRSVLKDTPAEKAGVKAGDVLVKVEGSEVSTPKELTTVLRAHTGKTVSVTLMREKRETAVNVTLEAAGNQVPARASQR